MGLLSWQDDNIFRFTILPETTGITLVGPERLYILYQLVKQVQSLNSCFAEVGVYKGGTARLVYRTAELSRRRLPVFRRLYLCDTFEGMPETDSEVDKHKKGDFADTSLEKVSSLFKGCENVEFYKGKFPESAPPASNCFGSRYSLVHIDCDIYQSVKDCCKFFYDRMETGGVMIFDDYGFPSCPGAKLAVDEFFRDKKEFPIVLNTGQCLVIKL